MESKLAGALASLTVAALVGGGGARVHAKPRPQQLFVSVLDRTGTPVRDLGAADFEVREGGKRRDVARAALATALKSRVAVLIDNGFLTGQSVTPLRTALQSLVDGVPPETEVVLGTISPQFRVKIKPTTDRRELHAGIDTLFATTTSGTALIDGLIEIDDRFLKPARDRWPVFVIVTSDSPEVSGRQIEDFNSRIQELAQRGARVHAVVIAYSSKARGNEPEMCMALTQSTGGTYDPVATITSVPDKVKAIGMRISETLQRAADEYLVEFTRESDRDPIEVSVPIPGVVVHVSMAP